MSGSILESGQQFINQQFAGVPADKRSALVAVVDGQGASFGVAARFGEHWQLAADVEKEWAAKGLNARLVVMGSW